MISLTVLALCPSVSVELNEVQKGDFGPSLMTERAKNFRLGRIGLLCLALFLSVPKVSEWLKQLYCPSVLKRLFGGHEKIFELFLSFAALPERHNLHTKHSYNPLR